MVEYRLIEPGEYQSELLSEVGFPGREGWSTQPSYWSSWILSLFHSSLGRWRKESIGQRNVTETAFHQNLSNLLGIRVSKRSD